MSVVVITGAAGLVGSMLRPRLARPGRTLRVLDIAPLTAGPGEEAIAASVTDMDAMTAACQGGRVIHLAGIPGERPGAHLTNTAAATAFEAPAGGVAGDLRLSSQIAVQMISASFSVPAPRPPRGVT